MYLCVVEDIPTIKHGQSTDMNLLHVVQHSYIAFHPAFLYQLRIGWWYQVRQKKGKTGSFNMMTSSNGNIFRVTVPLCGEFTGPGDFPTQRPVTRSFDIFFDLRMNKRLSKQPWGWWFEMASWSLWRQCNDGKGNHGGNQNFTTRIWCVK